MPFNDDFLYIPLEFREIEELFLIEYNKYFNKDYTIENFKYSNVYFIFFIAIQLLVENENNKALLFNNIISYLKDRKELEFVPKGSTRVGLEKALLDLSFVKSVLIADSNNFESDFQAGQAGIVIEYEKNDENNREIANTLLNNLGVGVELLGDIAEFATSYITQDSTTYKWQEPVKTQLFVKLFVKYSKNFYGERLTLTQIKDIYLQKFNEIYNLGNDIEPARMNSLTYYNSLSYVDSQFALVKDSWLPKNEILKSTFKQKFILTSNDITIIPE